VGYWGPNLARNFFQIEECELCWLSDLNKDRLEYVSEQCPGIRTTRQFDDILGDDSVDAVVIATPVETHFEIAMAAMDAGKHTFIEKPMTGQAKEALEIVNIAQQKELKVGTGHIFVYHPAVSRMKELLTANRIGQLYYAHSTRMNPAPSHGNVDVIWDLAVHDISIALYLWDQAPERVRASGGRFAHGDRADAATIELCFADGPMSTSHVGWLTSSKERRFFVAGENGSMRFDDTAVDKLVIIGPAVDTRKDATAQKGHISYAPGEIHVPQLPDEEPLKKECTNFVRAVQGKNRMVSDGRFGHAVVQVLEAASLSLKNKGDMIPLETGRIT
jgi:predicted dehydrogenase